MKKLMQFLMGNRMRIGILTENLIQGWLDNVNIMRIGIYGEIHARHHQVCVIIFDFKYRNFIHD